MAPFVVSQVCVSRWEAKRSAYAAPLPASDQCIVGDTTPSLAVLLELLQFIIMPKRKEPELKPKEQFKRFVEAAKKLEVDESGKDFERAFNKAVPPKRRVKQKRG